MKVELDKLREKQKEKETENNINSSRMRIFISLDDMISNCNQRLQKIENMCVYPPKNKQLKENNLIV